MRSVAQTIINKDLEYLLGEGEHLLMCMSQRYLNKVRYGVGEGYDEVDYIKVSWLLELLCQENCLVCEYEDKIREVLHLLTLKYRD